MRKYWFDRFIYTIGCLMIPTQKKNDIITAIVLLSIVTFIFIMGQSFEKKKFGQKRPLLIPK